MPVGVFCQGFAVAGLGAFCHSGQKKATKDLPMNKCVPIILLCLSTAALGRSVPIDGVAAFVNAHEVTLGDVMSAVGPAQARLRNSYHGAELQAKLSEAYSNALNALIENKLVMDAYDREDNKIPDDALKARVDEIMRDRMEGNRPAFMAALVQEGLSLDDWRAEIRERLIVSYMRSRLGAAKGIVSPKLVLETYQQTGDKYRVSEKVRLRVITIPAGAEGDAESALRQMNLAKSIRDKALVGEDFGDLAKAHSSGNKASEGGDWGWFDPADLRTELAKAASALKPGEISTVVPCQGDLYILKVEGRQEASVISFEQAQPDIERELTKIENERLYSEWIARLRKQAHIKIFEIGAPE
jgi:peptidyl-prolyl cis-trans isomerase SurA